MIRYEKSSLSPWISPGRSGRDQLQLELVRRRPTRCPSRRNSALKPISSGSPANGAGSDSLRLADVLGLRRHRQLALGEAQPQRRVALRHDRRAPDDVEELAHAAASHRARTSPAGAACSSGTARRSGASSARRRRRRRRRGSRVRRARARRRRRRSRPSSVSARAGTIASSSVRRALERRLLDGQPVRVRRRHHELARLEADEDPGQHRARLVARGRARDLGDRSRAAPRASTPKVCAAVDVRQPREVLGAVGVQPVLRPTRTTIIEHAFLRRGARARTSSPAAGAQGRRAGGRDDDRALAVDLRLERRAQRELHVGRSQVEPPPRARSEHPERICTAVRVDTARDDDRELRDELVARDT